MPDIEYVCTLVTHLHTEFHMPSSNGLLVVAHESKTKRYVTHGRHLVSHYKKAYLNKPKVLLTTKVFYCHKLVRHV
jgi:hypothetical protein